MSNRVITASLTFTFEPYGEHEDLFEEMTEDEMLDYALSMATEDALRAEPRMFDVRFVDED